MRITIKKITRKIKDIFNDDKFFYISLFITVIYFYKNAFSINFFSDDFFFLKISRAKTLYDFLHFFSPFRDYSYKPLATEVFYFLLHLLKYNILIGHIIVFITYFIGLIYLYLVICFVTNKLLSKIIVLFYAINLTHVFQLYWFATYQEIALFTTLIISFYYFLKNKHKLSLLFYFLALLTKETAVLFILFLFIIVLFYKNKYLDRKNIFIFLYIFLTVIFTFLYKYSLSHVIALDNYKLQFNNPRMIINNAMWYFLWGLGFVNFIPDYFPSIFSKPLPVFWELFTSPDIKNYFYLFLFYLILFAVLLVFFLIRNPKEVKKILILFFISILCFFIFLGPILAFPLKWIVRLMLPLIFLSISQGYLLFTFIKQNNYMFKMAVIILISTYLLWNYFGIKTHESSSLYLAQNRLYENSQKFFSINMTEIRQNRYIYFAGDRSKELKNAFHDQSFIDHFFPNSKLIAVYGFEVDKIPKNVYIINSDGFFR